VEQETILWSCVQAGTNASKNPGLSPGMIAALQEKERHKLINKLDTKIMYELQPHPAFALVRNQ
jgi:hypothetical protein